MYEIPQKGKRVLHTSDQKTWEQLCRDAKVGASWYQVGYDTRIKAESTGLFVKNGFVDSWCESAWWNSEDCDERDLHHIELDGKKLVSNKTTNNKNMSIKKLGIMMKKLLDGDTQKLVKAGFINGDLELTTEGVAALTAVLFDANKAALVTEAEAIIAEEEAAKNK